jgi:hypothetical protein
MDILKMQKLNILTNDFKTRRARFIVATANLLASPTLLINRALLLIGVNQASIVSRLIY